MFIRINDIDLKVDTCISEKKKQKGMMKKRFTDFDGMLFFMGSGNHCMYMKNCIIPLDIVFLDSNLNIVEIFADCPPCETKKCETYCSDGNYILELPGGFCYENKIFIGDSCSFEL